MTANGPFTTDLALLTAWAVPYGFLRSGYTFSPSGMSVSSWNTYSTAICLATLSPIASLNSSRFSLFIMNMTFSNPARFASNIEKSIILSFSSSTVSICLSPPYRLPMPAAIITSTGLSIYFVSSFFLTVRTGSLVTSMPSLLNVRISAGESITEVCA